MSTRTVNQGGIRLTAADASTAVRSPRSGHHSPNKCGPEGPLTVVFDVIPAQCCALKRSVGVAIRKSPTILFRVAVL